MSRSSLNPRPCTVLYSRILDITQYDRRMYRANKFIVTTAFHMRSKNYKNYVKLAACLKSNLDLDFTFITRFESSVPHQTDRLVSFFFFLHWCPAQLVQFVGFHDILEANMCSCTTYSESCGRLINSYQNQIQQGRFFITRLIKLHTLYL